jgi:hypothetical protein
MVIRLLKVLAPRREQFRIGGYDNPVQPARQKERKRQADVACEERFGYPQRLGLEYGAEKTEGECETGCEKKFWVRHEWFFFFFEGGNK